MEAWAIIIVLIILILIALVYRYTQASGEVPFCIKAHSQDHDNYPWLADIHGGLDHITYEEPPGSGEKEYTDQIWYYHCARIDHKDDLVEAHMRTFVNPGRPIKLNFYFKDGTKMEPIEDFYRREAAWFKAKRGK